MCQKLQPLIHPAFLLLVAIGYVSVISKADEATKQRFLDEYPSASKYLMDRFQNVQCTFGDAEPSNVIEMIVRFRKNGDRELMHSHIINHLEGKRISNENVISFSNRIVFALNKRDYRTEFESMTVDSSIVSSVIENYQATKSVRKTAQRVLNRMTNYNRTNSIEKVYDIECIRYVFASWGGGRSKIERSMSEPDFELIDAFPISTEPGIVEVIYRNHPDSAQTLETTCRFDTNNHWAVTSLVTRVAMSQSGLHSNATPALNWYDIDELQVRYGPKIDGVAWPETVSGMNRPPVRLIDWTFEASPEAIFRLSHYGLKEPLIDWSSPTPWAVGVITTMIAVMMAIRLIRNRRKRRRALPLGMIGSASKDLKCDLERSV